MSKQYKFVCPSCGEEECLVEIIVRPTMQLDITGLTVTDNKGIIPSYTENWDEERDDERSFHCSNCDDPFEQQSYEEMIEDGMFVEVKEDEDDEASEGNA